MHNSLSEMMPPPPEDWNMSSKCTQNEADRMFDLYFSESAPNHFSHSIDASRSDRIESQELEPITPQFVSKTIGSDKQTRKVAKDLAQVKPAAYSIRKPRESPQQNQDASTYLQNSIISSTSSNQAPSTASGSSHHPLRKLKNPSLISQNSHAYGSSTSVTSGIRPLSRAQSVNSLNMRQSNTTLSSIGRQGGSLRRAFGSMTSLFSSKLSLTSTVVATVGTYVILLDGTEVYMDLNENASGNTLMDLVAAEVGFTETVFFGFVYIHEKHETWLWLDMDKKISKQMKGCKVWRFYLQIKFFPPEPDVQMSGESSRYQLCLQLRHDIYTGKLPCSWETLALLGSYLVQSELGDYDESMNTSAVQNGTTFISPMNSLTSNSRRDGMNSQSGNSTTNTPWSYLSNMHFHHSQDDKLLEKISQLHKRHRGMLPGEADMHYLSVARRLEHYGLDLHCAKDAEDVPIHVGVCASGVFIYREARRLLRLAWPSVLRITRKKSIFYLRLRLQFESKNFPKWIGFRMESEAIAKRVWKTAVEHHAFFRLKGKDETATFHSRSSSVKHRVSAPSDVRRSASSVPASSKYGSSASIKTTIRGGSARKQAQNYRGKTLFQHRKLSTSNAEQVEDSATNRLRTRSLSVGGGSSLFSPDTISLYSRSDGNGLLQTNMHSLHRPHPRAMKTHLNSVEYQGLRSYASLLAPRSRSMAEAFQMLENTSSLPPPHKQTYHMVDDASYASTNCSLGSSFSSNLTNNEQFKNKPTLTGLQISSESRSKYQQNNAKPSSLTPGQPLIYHQVQNEQFV